MPPERSHRISSTLRCLTSFQVGATFIMLTLASMTVSANQCLSFYEGHGSKRSSFNEVLRVMETQHYDGDLPVIPIRIWKFFGKRLSYFVAQRSTEILKDSSDYRQTPMEKPIHSMGVGLVGTLKMSRSRWSGVFSGGEFPVLARASISQGNPLKITDDGTPQKRSTAMALKVFNTKNPDEKTTTANAVFQNDLNGLLAPSGDAINFLQSTQSNHPNVDFTKVKKSYEWLTLVGVAIGSIRTPKDHTRKFPFINPQIRPVHSLAELGVKDIESIKTPTWVRIQPREVLEPVLESDFRWEIAKTITANSEIVYDIFASDYKSPNGDIQWIPVGQLIFNRAILSAGVDKSLLFAHDSLNSKRTGKAFELPKPSSQYQPIPDDVE